MYEGDSVFGTVRDRWKGGKNLAKRVMDGKVENSKARRMMDGKVEDSEARRRMDCKMERFKGRKKAKEILRQHPKFKRMKQAQENQSRRSRNEPVMGSQGGKPGYQVTKWSQEKKTFCSQTNNARREKKSRFEARVSKKNM
jgi:hypothetical protein